MFTVEIDWFSVCLAILIVLIFLAIFTLLRTMNSAYIKRFDVLVKGSLEEIAGKDESYRIKFILEGREFEILELKDETTQNYKKVYNSFVLMRAKTNTSFTLRVEDILTHTAIASVLDKVLKERIDSGAIELDAKSFGDFFKNFIISTNDAAKAQKFLTDQQVLTVLSAYKSQFSTYGFLMPFLVSRGELVLDYSLSERLLNELVFNPRNILEHAKMLNLLACRIEAQ